MENNFVNIRVFYHKIKRAKYISHLDTARCMQRALTRTTLPVWYTEGFNPHIYLTFALPLSLGYESLSESMDLRLTEDVDFEEVQRRLNESLPEDIRVTKVCLPKSKADVISTALYKITISSIYHEATLLYDCFCNMISQEKIEVIKRTKKGNKLIDIKQDIEVLSCTIVDNYMSICLRTSAGIEKNVNPTLLTDELAGKYNLEGLQVAVVRVGIYDKNGDEFE